MIENTSIPLQLERDWMRRAKDKSKAREGPEQYYKSPGFVVIKTRDNPNFNSKQLKMAQTPFLQENAPFT